MPSELHDTFRNNVRARRTQLGMTQQQLANEMNVHRVRVCEIEAGRNVPTLDLVDKLAKVLQISPDKLLKPPRKVAKSA